MTSRESVSTVELSAESHPDLADHVRDDAVVFPGVLALEAMAQAAAPLAALRGVPVIENAEFHRPVVIPAGGSAAISIAARAARDRVEVEITGSPAGHARAHARATLHYTGAGPLGTSRQHPPGHRVRVPLDPAADLYGVILPPGRRLQRILGYRKLTAGSCVAEISTEAGPRRPGSFPAAEPVLGDPGVRHAFLDAIQGCAPDVRLRPVAVDRLSPAGGYRAGLVIVSATERYRHGATRTYDLDVHTPDGQLLERWEGLHLVTEPERTKHPENQEHQDARPWVPALLGPYLERGLESLIGGKPRCVVEPEAGDRDAHRGQLTEAVRRALGRPALVWHRADGRPEVAEEGIFISAAHGAGVLLAVASTGRIGCDARAVRERSSRDWRALLDPGQFDLAERIGRNTGEPLCVAATRVWGAAEHLRQEQQRQEHVRQASRADAAPMTLTGSRPDGWVQLGCGQTLITTFGARLRDVAHPVMFTIATQASATQAIATQASATHASATQAP
jgi:enediyne polyketide synthase